MVEKIAHKLTRKPKVVLLVALLMLIPAGLGFIATRINYDILSYLPQDLPSSRGEQLLEEPFHMAATSMLIVEDMPAGYTNRLLQEIKEVPGVSNAVWISNLVGIQIPVDMIPADFREIFFSGEATMMLIQYDHAGASDETMEAIQQVRSVCNEKCFLAGFSVVIKDTRDVMDSELPISASALYRAYDYQLCPAGGHGRLCHPDDVPALVQGTEAPPAGLPVPAEETTAAVEAEAAVVGAGQEEGEEP